MKKPAMISVSLLIACSALSGCATTGKEGAAPSADPGKPKEPVEISFYLYSMSQKDFTKYYEEPLKAKFPHVTAKAIVPQKGQFISELVTAGTVPDVIIGSKKTIEDTMMKFELAEDITPLIQKHRYDLSKLNPSLIDAMKVNAGGKTIGLPLDESRTVLYYNKDLFDKFGVAYPKDGMTWDQVYDIAKTMTRTVDGVQYYGYSDRYHDLLLYQNPYGYSTLSAQEEKASINNDQWKKLLDNMLRFYTLPGITLTKQAAASEELKNLFPKGLSAMQLFPQDTSNWQFNFDIVSMPTYADAPGVGTPVSARYNFITKTSAHKDDVFEVIAYLTSEERQIHAAKDGIIPALKMSDTWMKVFKENDPLLKGKNIGAYFKYQYGKEIPPRAAGLLQNLQQKGIGILETEVRNVLAGEKDLNTALRAADETFNKEIAAEKAKQK
ncbi:hypothetical protein PAESOLCIP111_04882 [Paenibacillus solanacearum]|uniref:Extracellular solute-binding protein n=1 Tax=Paenibacillus solanacearum TaxID=2048548 RepID=A0A916K8D5_9BACL|nr:extracellular solute-binding protein [Paenibacillus solanacearum]CAG7645115.1 hypothetical protein PAESOLCIP111_04882 [Paenibacillus solanacearum]